MLQRHRLIAVTCLLQLRSNLLQLQAPRLERYKSIQQLFWKRRGDAVERFLRRNGTRGALLARFTRVYVRLKFGMRAQEAEVRELRRRRDGQQHVGNRRQQGKRRRGAEPEQVPAIQKRCLDVLAE